MIHNLSLLLLIMSAFLAAGCSSDGPALGDVEGRVTLDGIPLADAVVAFAPTTPHRTSTGLTDAQGHFSLTYLRDIRGAVIGQHTVSIRRLPQSESSRVHNPLPAKYNTASQLTAEVQRGDNEFSFELFASDR